MRDLIDYQNIVDRIKAQILVHSIIGPAWKVTSDAQFAKWEKNPGDFSLMREWIESASKADASAEVVATLKIILGES